MAYSIFTQPRGPNIDVNLFPESANAGIAGGNRLGSPISAAIEGGIRGYQTGQQIREADQNIALRQARIDNLPTEIRIQQQQADLNDLKLEAARTNKQLALDAESTNLQNQIGKNRTEIQLRQDRIDFQREYAAADEAGRKALITSNRFGDMFSKDRQFYMQTLNNEYLRATDPQYKEDLGVYLRKSQIKQYGAARAAANEDAFNKASATVESDDLGLQKYFPSLTKQQIPEMITDEPAGKFRVDPDRPGVVVQDPNWSPDKKSPYIDILSADRSRILEQSVDPAKYAPYKQYRDLKAVVDGSQTGKQLKQIDDEHAARNNPPPVAKTQIQTKSAVKDPTLTAVQTKFALSPETTKRVEPQIKQMNFMVQEYAKSADDRAAIQDSLTRQLNPLARFISDAAYDSNPAIQADNDQAKVDAWNKSLEDLPPYIRASKTVLDGKSLYYQKSGPGIFTYLQGIQNRLIEEAIHAKLQPVIYAQNKQAQLSALGKKMGQ